jgi:hypothetical protein
VTTDEKSEFIQVLEENPSHGFLPQEMEGFVQPEVDKLQRRSDDNSNKETDRIIHCGEFPIGDCGGASNIVAERNSMINANDAFPPVRPLLHLCSLWIHGCSQHHCSSSEVGSDNVLMKRKIEHIDI